ncbi:MAG: BMP family ABC transporter substrate-binding protein [Rhodobacteraceae bacterium]|nr:BMP family ABC transporter substrate-binding protein [Paracoccaceae bacterium]
MNPTFKRIARAVAGALLALGLAAPVAAQDDPFHVGFVYVGPVGDYGWTWTHDQGRQAVEEAYGDKVHTTYVESVPEGADAERVMTQMILNGADMIFTTSFGYMDATNNVAARFPDVVFEHATGYRRDHPNVATYSARFYEGRAVMGHIAGHMTESNIVGYIASHPIPEVIRGINAAYLHAAQVNPDVEFRIVWVYTWFDPAVEADAAQALVDAGADVVLQHTDSTAPMTVLAEAGAYGFGQASDMLQFAPAPRISAILDQWSAYYVRRVGEAMEGTWEQADTWDGISAGMVGIGKMTDAIPPEVRASAMALLDSIASGEYHPFTGPINTQDGQVWLTAGETPEDGPLAGMEFYVEGIDAEIPN